MSDGKNMTVPHAIMDALARDKLILFVGAGLSTGAGLPSWEKLVLNILETQKNNIEKSSAYINALAIKAGYHKFSLRITFCFAHPVF